MLERPEPDAFALLMPLLAVAVSAYDVCLHVCMLYGACSYLLRWLNARHYTPSPGSFTRGKFRANRADTMRRLLRAPVRRRLAAQCARALGTAACPCRSYSLQSQPAPALLDSARAMATRTKRALPPSIIVVRAPAHRAPPDRR